MFVNEHTRIIQRYTVFSQYFGLAPISKLPFSVNFNTSKIKFAMSVAYLLLQAGHVIFHVMKMYEKIRLTKMSNIIHFVWMFQCLLTNILVTAQSLLASNHLVAYINELCIIDLEFQSKQQIMTMHRQKSRKHLFIMIFVMVMSFLLTWTLYGCVAFFHPNLISLFAFIFIPSGFMSMRVFQIIHSIELLNDHLGTINDRLRSIAERTDGNRTNNDLITLRRLYGRCWNAMQLYNVCFGFSNLMLLLFYSYDVLHGIYSLFLNIHGLRPDLVVLYGISSLPSAINLFAITNAAERCQNKAKETGVCLGNIWSQSSCHVNLKRFSVQVIHQPFLITACGLFVVNFKFLGGIVVGFSNLLVLFIQFEISENSGK